MLTEVEILDRHVQSLKEARQLCWFMASQVEPEYVAPRGRNYAKLRTALKECEGCCRQMSHWRADARWVRAGILYARLIRAAQQKFVGQQWSWFGSAILVLDRLLATMRDLAERKTGTVGPILPTQPTDWLRIPDLKIPTPPRYGGLN